MTVPFRNSPIRCYKFLIFSLFFCFALFGGLVPTGRATDLTWDAGNTGDGGTIDTASGNWDTFTLNWNNGSGNMAWTQTSSTAPTTNAIFGGTDGNYNISVAT
jgi:hypothetical protein